MPAETGFFPSQMGTLGTQSTVRGHWTADSGHGIEMKECLGATTALMIDSEITLPKLLGRRANTTGYHDL
jgi:hypothetical protein